MTSRHFGRSVPGHLAFVLSMLVGATAMDIAVYSYFYEGWGQGAANAAAYLIPPVLVVTVCAIATRWPRAGGLVCLAGGLGAGARWLWKQSAAGGGLSAAVVQTAVAIFTPILLMGALFLLEARHRRLLAAEGALRASGWWARYHRPVLVVAVPILALLLGPGRQLPDMLARHDDGQRGVRTIAGNGVTLTWAPQGPGWNQVQPDGTYPSWDAIASYGGDGAGLCGHLSEDGSALVDAPLRAWRLPTSAEVIGSLTRGGANAGCAWDGRADHATCARPPDKETPLWAPDQPPIYYLTSDPAGDAFVLGVNYTGGVTPHRRTAASRGVGYRCVAAAQTQEVSMPDLRGPSSAPNDVFRVEDRAMELWRQGKPLAWADASADDVSYLDPTLAAPVIGVEAYREYLKPLVGKVAYDASEYVQPRVARYGDVAVLTYNYHSLRRGADGTRHRTSFWNTTEVYRRAGDQWRIAHTHWSYIGHKLVAGVERTVGTGVREPQAAGVAGDLLALEAGALARWRKGDSSGFVALAAPEITGFDPDSPRRLTGLAAVRAALETRARAMSFDAAEFVNPRVQAYGDAAVLTYQLLAVVLDSDGSAKSRTPWHVSEVFVRVGGAWRLVHTHWSYVKGVREGGGV